MKKSFHLPSNAVWKPLRNSQANMFRDLEDRIMEYPTNPNTGHLVYYKPQEHEPTMFYNFELNKYIKCIAYDTQPYGLYNYRYLNKDNEPLEFEDGTPNTFITCPDSYRIGSGLEEDEDLDEIIERLNNENTEDLKELMYKEKKWRERIYLTDNRHPEFDFKVDEFNWAQGAVAWRKADIVPGVLCIQARGSNSGSRGMICYMGGQK